MSGLHSFSLSPRSLHYRARPFTKFRKPSHRLTVSTNFLIEREDRSCSSTCGSPNFRVRHFFSVSCTRWPRQDQRGPFSFVNSYPHLYSGATNSFSVQHVSYGCISISYPHQSPTSPQIVTKTTALCDEQSTGLTTNPDRIGPGMVFIDGFSATIRSCFDETKPYPKAYQSCQLDANWFILKNTDGDVHVYFAANGQAHQSCLYQNGGKHVPLSGTQPCQDTQDDAYCSSLGNVLGCSRWLKKAVYGANPYWDQKTKETPTMGNRG